MNNLGPYRARRDGGIDYVGNRLYPPVDAMAKHIDISSLRQRLSDISSNAIWGSLARILSIMFRASTGYFNSRGALFIPLPLTTRMISSPGALYGERRSGFSSDTVPISLKWFDEARPIYLSESSQIYLELALSQPGVDQVYSIYNSFRKETSDVTHLAEFHHVEFEAKVDAAANNTVVEQLVRTILMALLSEAEADLLVFLTETQLRGLQAVASQPHLFIPTSLQECYAALHSDTGDNKYDSFTLENRFNRWEELRSAEIFGGSLAISGYPLYEVPFYHDEVPNTVPLQAANTDFVWAGYAEVVGAGQRIRSLDLLQQKAAYFGLPLADYEPYMTLRMSTHYTQSSGFGLGWERLTQAILCLPSIALACPFPRTHHGVIP